MDHPDARLDPRPECPISVEQKEARERAGGGEERRVGDEELEGDAHQRGEGGGAPAPEDEVLQGVGCRVNRLELTDLRKVRLEDAPLELSTWLPTSARKMRIAHVTPLVHRDDERGQRVERPHPARLCVSNKALALGVEDDRVAEAQVAPCPLRSLVGLPVQFKPAVVLDVAFQSRELEDYPPNIVITRVMVVILEGDVATGEWARHVESESARVVRSPLGVPCHFEDVGAGGMALKQDHRVRVAREGEAVEGG